MRALLLVVVALVLGACQTVGVERDSLGNIYPPECRGTVAVDGYYHVLNGARGVVRYSPRQQMPKIPGTKDGHYSAVAASGGKSGISGISIADDVPEGLRTDMVKHELCHAIAGNWHGTGGEEERYNSRVVN